METKNEVYAMSSLEDMKDCVCGKDVGKGLYVDTPVWPFVADYKGKKYYFCSKECLDKFEAEPKVYVEKQ